MCFKARQAGENKWRPASTRHQTSRMKAVGPKDAKLTLDHVSRAVTGRTRPTPATSCYVMPFSRERRSGDCIRHRRRAVEAADSGYVTGTPLFHSYSPSLHGKVGREVGLVFWRVLGASLNGRRKTSP